MSIKIAVMAVILTGSVSFIAGRTIDRRMGAEAQRMLASARQKAETAEQRAEGYRRLLSANTIEQAHPEAEARPSPLANVPFPFDETLVELRSLLDLTDEQAVRFRGLYEEQWEKAKEVSLTGTAPAQAESASLDARAREFLSPEQSRKYGDYVKNKLETEGRKVAATQAQQFKAPLGLRDDQIPLVADALFRLYSGSAGPTGPATVFDQLADLLTPILNNEQRQALLAMGKSAPAPARAN